MGIELRDVFKKQTDLYKKRVEKNTFDLKYRRRLLESAKGNVLEVAVGAGVNFQFYNSNLEVTAVDFVPGLSEIAKQVAAKNKIKANFIIQDVESLEFEDNSFDTIVSTWSLCTYKNPLQVLNNFNKWCKPSGQILLFEHGLNGNYFLDWPLRKIDSWHMRKRGCHANTDVFKLVNNSYLLAEKVEKVLFYYYLIWAKPNKTIGVR